MKEKLNDSGSIEGNQINDDHNYGGNILEKSGLSLESVSAKSNFQKWTGLDNLLMAAEVDDETMSAEGVRYTNIYNIPEEHQELRNNGGGEPSSLVSKIMFFGFIAMILGIVIFILVNEMKKISPISLAVFLGVVICFVINELWKIS
jgi:hypothetical protein